MRNVLDGLLCLAAKAERTNTTRQRKKIKFSKKKNSSIKKVKNKDSKFMKIEQKQSTVSFYQIKLPHDFLKISEFPLFSIIFNSKTPVAIDRDRFEDHTAIFWN